MSLLLDHANQGQFDIVVVHTIDRWARNMRVQTEALEILGRAKVGFASVTENIDYTTPEGTLMLTMIGGFAEFFSAQLARHAQKGARQRAEQGLQNGSIPFGYRKDDESGIPCPVPGGGGGASDRVREARGGRDAQCNRALAQWPGLPHPQGQAVHPGSQCATYSASGSISAS